MIILIYVALGIGLMIIGSMLVDLIIPGNFPEEIKKGNNAIGLIMASISISVGVIFKASVASPLTETVKLTLLQDLGVVGIYYILGILALMAGYKVTSIFNKKYDLDNEVLKGNSAAGLVVSGLFIGIAIIISGVII